MSRREMGMAWNLLERLGCSHGRSAVTFSCIHFSRVSQELSFGTAIYVVRLLLQHFTAVCADG